MRCFCFCVRTPESAGSSMSHHADGTNKWVIGCFHGNRSDAAGSVRWVHRVHNVFKGEITLQTPVITVSLS